MRIQALFTFFLSALITWENLGQIDLSYQEPPDEIRKLADVPPAPRVLVQETGDWLVILHRPPYKSIAEVAADEYRLAGLRINPRTNGQSRSRFYNDITLQHMHDGRQVKVKGLPVNPRVGNVGWSPDYSRIAFTNDTQYGIELWVVNLSIGTAARVLGAELNDIFGGLPYEWKKDSRSLICKVIDPDRKPLIPEDKVPEGPVIQENLGKKAPARTYQDLLENKDDEQNFDHFALSRLVEVDLEGNKSDFMGSDIYIDMDVSPDGNYMLVETIHKPYSYLVPYYRFPRKTEIVDMKGNSIKILYDAPLEEVRPKGFMATSSWPRSFGWRKDKPAEVYWVQALDEGDPEKEAEYRDAVYLLEEPFEDEGRMFARTKLRYSYIQWGNDQMAVLRDFWWNTRRITKYMIDPSVENMEPKVIFDYNYEDLYNLPGNFVSTVNDFGESILLTSGYNRFLYLTGEGYSPDGNRPFIDRYDTGSGETERLWRASGESTYEDIVEVLDITEGQLLTRIESPAVYPNFYTRNFKEDTDPVQVTDFPNPYESIKEVRKEMISYKRNDGVDLNATLYLPAEYDQSRDGKLPVLLWAYPREFKDSKAAGMVKDSPYRFTRISYGSPIFWVTRGYAILDRTDFPVVGEGEEEPNDSFVEQLVANADAAVNELDRRGVGDPQRVGVGGHSYGAFMVANLLAHSDLFAAGIARSGAYNRSLTPFGFQAEERTFWEAPEVYFKMSPFMHADKINEPILLIHGTLDNNSGTYPMQSERMYNAIKGHGGIARLVMLPYESHGYAARASVMHMLWEMDRWLDKYVKNRDVAGAGEQMIIQK